MTQHFLKIRPEFYYAVFEGIKTHEIRKNDRDYKVGDTIRFDLIKDDWHCFRAPEQYKITHILTSEEFPDGIKDGYAILSIKKMDDKRSVMDCELYGKIIDSNIHIGTDGVTQILVRDDFWFNADEITISPKEVCIIEHIGKGRAYICLDIHDFSKKALEKLKTFQNTRMVEI